MNGKETAVIIRKELKKAFNIKFSVRSDVTSVRIKWVGFPTVKHVESIVGKYSSVRRDAVTGEILGGGNLFIFCNNEYPEDIKEEIEALMPENLEHYNRYPHFNRIANELYKSKYQAQVVQTDKPKTKKKKVVQETKEVKNVEEVQEVKEVTEIKEPSGFQQRQQERIERYRALAEKNRKLSNALWNSPANQTLVNMQGEPIKVGHHSEKRHRKLFEKAHNDMGKAVDASNKAEYYEAKAEAIEINKEYIIYSDDEDAIFKLEKKLQDLKENHELMKRINKEYRTYKGDIDKINCSDELKVKIKQWKKAFKFSYSFIPFNLPSSNQNIRATEKRLERLKKQAQDTTTEIELDDVTIVDNVELNRLQIFFPDIPPKEFRKKLGSKGFRFSYKNGKAWQRHRSDYAKQIGIELVNEYNAI
ncbi:DUF3560 domain-containing protein [Shimazuella kribbensis]|uniref:DUF3560 domain-containing protein n=1 Tax=Shimazuella kribbensis TaxID=139808 RepID=UPI000409881E|nr:DUF3560 domain-containing protein [Shimazuella kribbensis]